MTWSCRANSTCSGNNRAVEARTAGQLVHLARRRCRHRPDSGAGRAGRRRRRLCLAVGDGPPLPDQERRRGRGADAGGHDGARLHGRPYPPPAPWIDGWRGALSPRRPVGQGTTTLDVLSGGRAWFGIGAAWNVAEARALGIPFPELPDRFALLADTLEMARLAWTGERGGSSYAGRLVSAGRLLNSPQALSKPRIPILVGGGGERTTLRLVARYADACNVFGGPDMLRHKFEVLRRRLRGGRPRLQLDRAHQPVNRLDYARRPRRLDGTGRVRRPAGGVGRGGDATHDRVGSRRVGCGQARADRPRRDPADRRHWANQARFR